MSRVELPQDVLKMFTDVFTGKNTNHGYFTTAVDIVSNKKISIKTQTNEIKDIVDSFIKSEPDFIINSDSIIKLLNNFVNDLGGGTSDKTITPTISDKLKEYFNQKKGYVFKSDQGKYFYTIIGTLVFAMDYKSFTIDKLFGNSANCLFFKSQCTRNNDQPTTENLFVKVVQYPIIDQDNILADNINGFILNQILTGGSKHFMTYVDSFLSFRKKVGRDYYWRVDQLADIRKNKGPLSLIQDSNIYTMYPDLDLAHISIFKAINGKSVSDMIKKAINTVNKYDSLYINEQLELISKINKFVKCFEFYGMNYGMIHNDLHTGNYFYDLETKSIRVIDYGRMHFGIASEKSEPSVNEFIKIEIMRNCAIKQDKCDTYESIMNNIHKHCKNIKGISNIPTSSNKNIYLGYFADIITLAGNLYEYYMNAKLPLHKEIHNIISTHLLHISNIQTGSRQSWGFELKTTKDDIVTKDILVTKYIKCKKDVFNIIDSSTVSDKDIIDGILCICIVMFSKGHTTGYKYNFNQMPFYYYFQLDNDVFTPLMTQLKTILQTQKDLGHDSPLARLKTVQTQNGGKKRRSRQKGGGLFGIQETFTEEPVGNSVEIDKQFDSSIEYFIDSYERTFQQTDIPFRKPYPKEPLINTQVHAQVQAQTKPQGKTETQVQSKSQSEVESTVLGNTLTEAKLIDMQNGIKRNEIPEYKPLTDKEHKSIDNDLFGTELPPDDRNLLNATKLTSDDRNLLNATMRAPRGVKNSSTTDNSMIKSTREVTIPVSLDNSVVNYSTLQNNKKPNANERPPPKNQQLGINENKQRSLEILENSTIYVNV
jgi:hypothetical protein